MRQVIEAAAFAAILFFIGAADSLLADPIDRCDAIELQATLAMSARQHRSVTADHWIAQDAARYPLYSHSEDQETIVRVFAEKHRNECRLREAGITLDLPWIATKD